MGIIQKKLVLYVNLLICCTSWINVGKINLTFKKQAYLITFGWPPPVIPYSSRRVHPSTVCLRQKKWKLIHEIMCLKAWDRKKNMIVHTRRLVLCGSSMKCVSGRIGEVSWCVPALFSEVKIFSQRSTSDAGVKTVVNDRCKWPSLTTARAVSVTYLRELWQRALRGWFPAETLNSNSTQQPLHRPPQQRGTRSFICLKIPPK